MHCYRNSCTVRVNKSYDSTRCRQSTRWWDFQNVTGPVLDVCANRACLRKQTNGCNRRNDGGHSYSVGAEGAVPTSRTARHGKDMAGIHLLLVMSSDKVRAYYCSLTVGTGLQLLHSLVFKFDDARGFQALGSVINSPIYDTTMLGLSVMHALRGCLSISTRKRVSSLVLSHWKICWRCHMARFLQCLAIWSM